MYSIDREKEGGEEEASTSYSIGDLLEQLLEQRNLCI